MTRDYYFAEVGEVKENGLFDEYWGFKVSKERIDTFSIESALRLLDFANQKFPEIIGRTVRFNYIKLEMDNKNTEYIGQTKIFSDSMKTACRSMKTITEPLRMIL